MLNRSRLTKRLQRTSFKRGQESLRTFPRLVDLAEMYINLTLNKHALADSPSAVFFVYALAVPTRKTAPSLDKITKVALKCEPPRTYQRCSAEISAYYSHAAGNWRVNERDPMRILETAVGFTVIVLVELNVEPKN
jgi:hypothetical protein